MTEQTPGQTALHWCGWCGEPAEVRVGVHWYCARHATDNLERSRDAHPSGHTRG